MRVPSFRHPRTRAALSLATATLAAVALFSYLRGVEARTARYGPLVRYLVATADIDIGARFEAASLAAREMPRNYLPDGLLQDAEAVVGRVARRPVAAGEPVLAADIAAPGAGDFSMLLARGQRACGVPLERLAFPAGICRAGDTVDLLAAGDGSCEAVLEGVTVLGLIEEGGSDAGSFAAASYGGGYLLLCLTERESEELAAAVAAEELTLMVSLRPWER